MKPAQRVMLDRRIAEEQMTELVPHGERPPAIGHYSDGERLHVWAMNSDGIVGRNWQVADEVDWSGVVACRLEDRWGNPIDPLHDGSEDMDAEA